VNVTVANNLDQLIVEFGAKIEIISSSVLEDKIKATNEFCKLLLTTASYNKVGGAKSLCQIVDWTVIVTLGYPSSFVVGTDTLDFN